MSTDLHFQSMLDENLSVIKGIRYSENAKPQYDLLSDSIFWEDELPAGLPSNAVSFIRYMLHIRTRSAQSANQARNPLWEYFRVLVPSWPGFREERCEKNYLISAYNELRTLVDLPDH
jgi:hypothetical protein